MGVNKIIYKGYQINYYYRDDLLDLAKKIIDGEMEQNEFYETRELNACAEQIDLEIVYNI